MNVYESYSRISHSDGGKMLVAINKDHTMIWEYNYHTVENFLIQVYSPSIIRTREFLTLRLSFTSFQQCDGLFSYFVVFIELHCNSTLALWNYHEVITSRLLPFAIKQGDDMIMWSVGLGALEVGKSNNSSSIDCFVWCCFPNACSLFLSESNLYTPISWRCNFHPWHLVE